MNFFGLPLDNPFTVAVTFLIWMALLKLLAMLVSVAVVIMVIIQMRRFETRELERHERTLEVLFFVKEWLQLGKFVRDDTRANTIRVANRLEQQAEVVKQVVESVPDKVVDKIKESAASGSVDSGSLPVVRPPTNPNPEGEK